MELVDEALSAGLTGADLTRQLLAFARRQPLKPKRTRVDAVVESVTRLLRRTLGAEIAVATRAAHDLWPVVIDPAQLEAALTNLAVNARDAMRAGGKLTIATRNESLNADRAAPPADIAVGDYVVLEVSDTGHGMSAEVLSRAFEPFFTTKPPGKGSGLGLSMVFGFVKQSGGHIQIDSAVGTGTTIRIYLPRAVDDGEAESRRPSVLATGSEVILAVEDNAILRRVLVRQLRDLGYAVLEAADGRSAVGLLRGSATVDLC